ncbi:MAG: 23S rRNA (adenine(2030)-N(6))-methyltransferase RlmJ [Pseudomonadota bacterium]
MNYRHAYHAGNFADVFKHILLTRLALYLQRKDKPIRLFDTHAGIGLYARDSEEQAKTGESTLGIEKVLAATTNPAIENLIGPWRTAVNAHWPKNIPGSPLIAKALLRKSDRLSVFEKHPDDAPVLERLFAEDWQTRVYPADGWLAGVSHIPPKESRGLVLVDPPFEDGKDFDRMIDFLKKSTKRWPGGIVALWYPVKKRDHTDEWLGTLRDMQFNNLLNAELYIREPRSPDMLNGCGMVIANAPYVLPDELATLLPWLAGVMRQDKGAGHRVQDLSKR